ncbi:hypothetical protein LTR17_002400 [Elasticomyces elasticus]|nr:hypothetical protein LTR17_002400 [Elasticomyces elasticus]
MSDQEYRPNVDGRDPAGAGGQSGEAAERQRAGGATDAIDEASQSAAATGTLEDGLRFLLTLLWKLGIYSFLGFLHEARVYLELEGTQVCRGFEGSPLDAAVFAKLLAGLAGMDYANKLDYLKTLSDDELGNALLLQDNKASSVRVPLRQQARFQPFIEVQMSEKQFENAAFIIVSLMNRPGYVAILPTPPTRNFNYGDPLMMHMPVPGRFAPFMERLDRLVDFFERIPAAVEAGALPDLHSIQWPAQIPRLGDDLELIDGAGFHGAAKLAFDTVRKGIEASPTATADGVSCRLNPYQPLFGDAIVNDHLSEFKWEMAEVFADGTLRVFNLAASIGATEQRIRRYSTWNPFREWEFNYIWTKNGRAVYVIPCSMVRKEYWTSAAYTDLPASTGIAKFRVDATKANWFEVAYTRILKHHPHPIRDQSIVPARVNAEDYRAALLRPQVTALEDEEDEILEDQQTEKDGGYLRSPGRHNGTAENIIRANEECAKQGFGAYLTLGPRSRAPAASRYGYLTSVGTYLYADQYKWNDSDKRIYKANSGSLPITPTMIDIGCHGVAMIIHAAAFQRSRKEAASTGLAPTTLSGSILKKYKSQLLVGSACLWLFEGFPWEDRHVPHSFIAIPSEFLDFSVVLARWSAAVGSEVGDWSEFRQKCEEKKMKPSQDLDDFDLQDCLVGGSRQLYVQEFMVRESKQFVDGVRNLFRDRVHKDESQVRWYEDGPPLMAKAWYGHKMQAVMQDVANKWLSYTQDDDAGLADEEDGAVSNEDRDSEESDSGIESSQLGAEEDWEEDWEDEDEDEDVPDPQGGGEDDSGLGSTGESAEE